MEIEMNIKTKNELITKIQTKKSTTPTNNSHLNQMFLSIKQLIQTIIFNRTIIAEIIFPTIMNLKIMVHKKMFILTKMVSTTKIIVIITMTFKIRIQYRIIITSKVITNLKSKYLISTRTKIMDISQLIKKKKRYLNMMMGKDI